MSRKRFIYQKVVTGMPVIPTRHFWGTAPYQPTRRQRRPIHTGLITFIPRVPEVITADKWQPIYPTILPKVRRRPAGGMFIDTSFFETPVAPGVPSMAGWFMPTSLPRPRARTLHPSRIPFGEPEFGQISPTATGTGFYKLKIRPESRRSNL